MCACARGAGLLTHVCLQRPKTMGEQLRELAEVADAADIVGQDEHSAYEKALVDRDSAAVARLTAEEERDNALATNEKATARDSMVTEEYKALRASADLLLKREKEMQTKLDATEKSNAKALSSWNKSVMERNEARDAHAETEKERDTARVAHAETEKERDTARAACTKMEKERDAARAAVKVATTERDAAHAAVKSATAACDTALEAKAAAIAEREKSEAAAEVVMKDCNQRLDEITTMEEALEETVKEKTELEKRLAEVEGTKLSNPADVRQLAYDFMADPSAFESVAGRDLAHILKAVTVLAEINKKLDAAVAGIDVPSMFMAWAALNSTAAEVKKHLQTGLTNLKSMSHDEAASPVGHFASGAKNAPGTDVSKHVVCTECYALLEPTAFFEANVQKMPCCGKPLKKLFACLVPVRCARCHLAVLTPAAQDDKTLRSNDESWCNWCSWCKDKEVTWMA